MTKESKQLTGRTETGKFMKGKSGNPAGRPKGRKNRITELKQDYEIAVRESVNPADIVNVMRKMVELAKEGDKGAAKIVLDTFVSKAKEGEDIDTGQGGIRVIVENATFQVADSGSAQEPKSIDGEATVIEE